MQKHAIDYQMVQLTVSKPVLTEIMTEAIYPNPSNWSRVSNPDFNTSKSILIQNIVHNHYSRMQH